MRWSENIAALSIVMAVMCGSAGAGTMDDGTTAGSASGQAVINRLGSQQGVNQLISQPMTSNGSQMQTLDGSQSFAANLTSASSARFLEILIQPSATGDLQRVIISQDLDTDGTIDNVYTLPRIVSGVCANGYISCTAGTWSHCQYYKWTAAADGRIADAVAQITDLGGCFCINSSCGNNLAWQNSSIVLQDLGGGVVSAIQNSNMGFTITNVSSSPTMIDYYGNVTGNVTTAAGSITSLVSSPAVVTLSGYRHDSAGLTAARDNMAIAGSTDPTSLYYMLQSFSSNSQSGATVGSCVITRNGSVRTTTQTVNDSGSGMACTDHLIFIMINKVSDTRYRMQYINTCPSGLICPYQNCNDNPGGNGWHTIQDVVLGQPDPNVMIKMIHANFSLNNIFGIGCIPGSGTVDGVMNGFDLPVLTSVVCSGVGSQIPFFNWSYYIQYAQDEYQESVDDQCGNMANNSSCRLQNETVDGVQTYLNFNPTGLIPLPHCRTYTGIAGSNTICRNWWQKQRSYLCTGGQQYDFSAVGRRFGTVTTSTTNNNNTSLTYDDQTLSGSTWTPSSGTINLPAIKQSPTCEMACKTKRTATNTQATFTGNVTANQIAPTSNFFYYRVCQNNLCPAGTGETIIEDCQCINDFAEAATIIQTLRTAGKDTICSTGVPSPL